jgi:hypothetical protein
MTARIGWYVHHHGRGHLTRFLAIAPHVDADISVFSSLPAPAELPASCSWTVLDRDDDPRDGRDPRDAEPTASGLLHWAPLGHAGHRGRLAAIAAAAEAQELDAFVVDVSAEVALLVRLLGVQPVLIAQPGIRDDEPHRLAFSAASAIIAPWPEALLRPDHLAPFAARTVFTGGISRFDGRVSAAGQDGVLLLGGAGGTAVTDEDIEEAIQATDREWTMLGDGRWSPDPWEALTRAAVVVSWAGQNAIADLAAAGARAVVVPQERPFAEQRATAAALERAGLAVVVPHWPTRQQWPDVLARASDIEPDWSAWQVGGAAARAAAVIERVARS